MTKACKGKEGQNRKKNDENLCVIRDLILIHKADISVEKRGCQMPDL